MGCVVACIKLSHIRSVHCRPNRCQDHGILVAWELQLGAGWPTRTERPVARYSDCGGALRTGRPCHIPNRSVSARRRTATCPPSFLLCLAARSDVDSTRRLMDGAPILHQSALAAKSAHGHVNRLSACSVCDAHHPPPTTSKCHSGHSETAPPLKEEGPSSSHNSAPVSAKA